jgi:hypothetical protein
MPALTLDMIIQEFGDYYLNSGQNLSRLKEALRQPSVTLEQFGTRITTKDTVYQMANPIFQPLIQPFRKQFEPKGNVDFHPVEIRLQRVKVDNEMYPHDIEDTWLGFLSGDSSRSLQDWPVVKWYLEHYIAPQVKSDKELHAVYKGVYSAIGTTPSDTMDGLKIQLIRGANDAQYPINVIDGIDVFTESTIFDQLEKYDNKISELYKNVPLIHFVSPNWVRAFKTAKRANGFYYIESANEINDRIDFTNHIVVGLPSMSGTNDIFTTVKENLMHVVKRKSDYDAANVDIQKSDRQVKLLCDWWEAIGFGCNQLVWTTTETVTEETSGSGS